MKIINLLKDILAPKKCYSCNEEGHFLCKKCFDKFDNYGEFCYICKKQSNKFLVHEECKNGIFYDNLITLTHYKNKIIKKLLIDFKFYGKKDISEDVANFMTNKILKANLNIINNKNILITNIPMRFIRKIKRGYNQSELLAENIANNLGIKYEKNILKKIKSTKQQALLSKKQRQLNLVNSFKISKKMLDNLDNKIIILIDDIVSTGSTINEASKVLKENKVKKIIGLTFASD